MNQLSDRLNSLSPSATLAMSQKSNELKAQGVDVINLSVGENRISILLTTSKKLRRKPLMITFLATLRYRVIRLYAMRLLRS